jgi:anti-anti-sigma factor
VLSPDAALEERASHALLLYRDQSHEQDTVASWFQEGVERGEKVLCATTDPGLVPRLTQRGVDVSAARQRNQVMVSSPEDCLAAGVQAAVFRDALEEGYSGVRVTVEANEALALLGEEGYRGFHRELDRLCGVLPVSALCRYDVRQEAALSLGSMVEIHPDAMQDGQARTRRRGDRLAVAGEVDLLSAEAFTAWLAAACRRAAGHEVIVDLSELVFIDVAGCRALVRGTEPFRDDAGVVLLYAMSRHTLEVMGLLGIDRLPGVQLS